jgi:hypothetical protein
MHRSIAGEAQLNMGLLADEQPQKVVDNSLDGSLGQVRQD